MKIFKLYTLLVFAFVCHTAFAQTTAEAKQAFRDADYARSAELFEQIIAQGMGEGKESAQLYYNLGNAYFRMNELGKAILNFERAFLLNPGDSDIRHNLRFARTHTTDRIEQSGTVFVTSWVNNLRNIFSSNQWAATGIALFLLFIGCIAVFMFVRMVWARKTAFYAGIVIFFLMIAANAFAFRQKSERANRDFAIVMPSGISVQASPNANSNQLFQLHEGTKVRIRNTDNDWYEIEIDNGSVGWTLRQNVERI